MEMSEHDSICKAKQCVRNCAVEIRLDPQSFSAQKQQFHKKVIFILQVEVNFVQLPMGQDFLFGTPACLDIQAELMDGD